MVYASRRAAEAASEQRGNRGPAGDAPEVSKTDVRVMTLAAIVLLTVCCGSRVQKQATAKEAATKDATDVDTSVADILFVPVDAKVDPPAPFGPIAVKNGRRIYIDGTTDIWFSVDADRQKLTTQLIRYFAARLASTHEPIPESGDRDVICRRRQHGCACLISRDANGHLKQRGQLFEWQGEWENARHDQVTYYFFAEDRAIPLRKVQGCKQANIGIEPILVTFRRFWLARRSLSPRCQSPSHLPHRASLLSGGIREPNPR